MNHFASQVKFPMHYFSRDQKVAVLQVLQFQGIYFQVSWASLQRISENLKNCF